MHEAKKNVYCQKIGWITRLNSFTGLTPKSRGNRHAIFKNFFVNYKINLLKYKRLNSFTGLTPKANPVEIISWCKQQQSIFVATPPPVTNVRLVVHEAKENVYCKKIGITWLNSFTGLTQRAVEIDTPYSKTFL